MFHSEYGQDCYVASLMPDRNLTFVEFGALDGLLHSNTLFLERECGWTGLLIEANPSAFVTLSINRPNQKLLNAAIFDRDGTVEFEKIEGGLYGWSGIRKTIEPQHKERINRHIPEGSRSLIQVPCMTLDDALSDFCLKDIGYLSIDVEGAEQAILSVFPFERYNIDIIGVEDNFGNPDLDHIITSNGFKFLGKLGPDRFYRSSRNTL